MLHKCFTFQAIKPGLEGSPISSLGGDGVGAHKAGDVDRTGEVMLRLCDVMVDDRKRILFLHWHVNALFLSLLALLGSLLPLEY